jgi:hypothetical protein
VQGLTLYVRLGDGPLVTSSLAIRVTDEALRRLYSEPDEPVYISRRKKKHAVGGILRASEQDIMVASAAIALTTSSSSSSTTASTRHFPCSATWPLIPSSPP